MRLIAHQRQRKTRRGDSGKRQRTWDVEPHSIHSSFANSPPDSYSMEAMHARPCTHARSEHDPTPATPTTLEDPVSRSLSTFIRFGVSARTRPSLDVRQNGWISDRARSFVIASTGGRASLLPTDHVTLALKLARISAQGRRELWNTSAGSKAVSCLARYYSIILSPGLPLSLLP